MTATLVIRQSEVRRLLPMARCIELVEEALESLARGEAQNPLRWGLPLDTGRGLLGMMPGAMGEPPVFGLKAVAVFPGNHAAGLDSHQGVVVLFEVEHGTPVAVLDASEVTAIRTAAASAVATRLLARPDAGDLAILGSGVQARTHLEAMAAVRTLRRVRVWSPTAAHREAFAAAAARRHGLAVEPVASAEEAVRGADLVCAVTAAREPVLRGAWLEPGAHVNAAGACVAAARELDTEAVARARLFVDRRESAENEAGDYLIPLREGAIAADHLVAEVGEVLIGRAEGRRDGGEITLFESLGLAVEDLAVGHYVYRRALQEGAGTPVTLADLGRSGD